MRNILLFFSALLISSSSFANPPGIAPITGPDSLCVGSPAPLADATTGGVWSSGNNSIATVGSLSGVVTGVAPGVDTITYAIPGTVLSATYTVTVNPLPAAISGSSTGLAPSVCTGSTLTLTDATSGGAWSCSPATIATIGSASGIVTGVAPGTATVTYTLPTGCSVSTVVIVNAPPAAITGPSIICTGHSITLSDATTGGAWSSSNNLVATAGSSSGIISGVSAGTASISYTLTSTGCSATFPVTVDPAPCASGVAATPNELKVSVFPNPVTDELTIQMNDGAFSSFTITNSIGQILMQQQLNSPQTDVDVKTLAPAAIYFITFRGQSGVTVRRFIKM